MTPHKTRRRVPGTRDPGQGKAENVCRDAGSAGVAADGGHRRVLAVLPGSLSHPARPDGLHRRSLAGLGGAAVSPGATERLRESGSVRRETTGRLRGLRQVCVKDVLSWVVSRALWTFLNSA